MWKERSLGERRVTRLFSRRYLSTLAPVMAPALSKSILMNFPYYNEIQDEIIGLFGCTKREELLLRTVWALPNASKIGFAWISRSSSDEDIDVEFPSPLPV